MLITATNKRMPSLVIDMLPDFEVFRDYLIKRRRKRTNLRSIFECLWCLKSQKEVYSDDRKTLLPRNCHGDTVRIQEKPYCALGYVNPSCPVNCSALSHCVQHSLQLEPQSHESRSGYFVFILAADIEETSQLSQQVISLTEELKKQQIPHVAVTSTVDAPIIYDLPSHLESSLFTQTNGDAHTSLSISACFRKATKVLMMVSPGYLRYADMYSRGAASNVASKQQEIIRGFHQKLKQEFFDKKDRIRVWPVLHLKAEPNHMPSFLRESIYYFYPPEPNSEDLLALLKWERDQYKG